jgi:ATP-dependent DNA helicase DinG
MCSEALMSILEHFPSDCTPRDSQQYILERIEKSTEKFIVVQAPTGSGKSHLAATVANSSNSPTPLYTNLVNDYQMFKREFQGGYLHRDTVMEMPRFGCSVLTVTKALQNQYDDLFNNSDLLKGKQNYVCELDNDFDCDFAPCTPAPKVMEQCKMVDRCRHLNAQRAAFVSKFSVYNYSTFLTLPEHIQQKQILICDEASELEDELVKYYQCHLDYKRMKIDDLGVSKLLTDDRNKAYRWLTDLSDKVKDRYETIQEAFSKHKDNKRLLKSKIIEYRMYKQMYEKLNLVLRNWNTTEYIVEPEGAGVKFTPLYVNHLAQTFFKAADKVILMSGTIIDHKMFADTLGIEKYDYLEVESEFDPKHSPIYCLDKFKLNYKTMDKVLPKVVDIAEQICAKYPDDKGIIHTHTFKITKALQTKFRKDKRFLTREPGVTNEYLLEKHRLSDQSTVIMSPSLGFGTDLSDDFGRFSIVMKAPYLPMGDKRIKTLMERSFRWYQMKALVNLVQMCGRTTRNKEDYSDTYILDATATELIKKNVDKLPKYFRDRLV